MTIASSLVLGYGALGAVFMAVFLVLDKYYGYEIPQKINEKYFILDKDNFIEYLYENEIPEKHINEIKQLKSEFIFIIKDDKDELQYIKKAVKNQIIEKIIKEDKKIREIINDTVTNELEKQKEMQKEEKENNEKLTAIYGDDAKTLEKSVNELSEKYDIDFGDLEGTIIPNDGDFILSLEKKTPKDKIVKFKIDDESNLYCKSNDFNSKKDLIITKKNLKESTHKILEERLAQLEKLKNTKESNKKKEGEGYILHEPKPQIPKDKKPFIITTKDGQKILVKPEEYSSLTNEIDTNEIELYFYPKEKFLKLKEENENKKKIKKIQDEYDKNKKEISDHNNDLWFLYKYKTKNNKKPDKGDVFYKGRLIKDFIFTEENSGIFLENQKGGALFGRSKSTENTLYIKKEALDDFINELREEPITKLIEIIKVYQKLNLSTSNFKDNIEIPLDISTDNNYFKLLTDEVFFNMDGSIVEDCFKNFPEEKNLAHILNFEKNRKYKVMIDGKEKNINDGCTIFGDCSPKGLFTKIK